MKLLKRLYKLLLVRKPEYFIGEVVFTEDNGYVKLTNITKVGYWYERKVIVVVKILKYDKNVTPYYSRSHDVYYNFKAFTKLPDNDIIKLLYED